MYTTSVDNISNEGLKDFITGAVRTGLQWLSKFINGKFVNKSEEMLNELATLPAMDTSANSIKIKYLDKKIFSDKLIAKWSEVQQQLDNFITKSRLTIDSVADEIAVKVTKDLSIKRLPERVLGLGSLGNDRLYSFKGNKIQAIQGTNKSGLIKFINTYMTITTDTRITVAEKFVNDSNKEKIINLALKKIKSVKKDIDDKTETAVRHIVENLNEELSFDLVSCLAAAIAIAEGVFEDMKQRHNKNVGTEDFSDIPTDIPANIETDLPEEGGSSDLIEEQVLSLQKDIDEGWRELEMVASDSDTIIEMNNLVQEAIDNGEGIDNTGAEIIVTTLENIYKRHGIPRRYINFKLPALESMDKVSSKLQMAKFLKVTLEEEENKMSGNDNTQDNNSESSEEKKEENKSSSNDGESAIKKAFNWLLEKISAIWEKLFDNFGKLGDKAAELKGKIEADLDDMKKNAKPYTLSRENPSDKQTEDWEVYKLEHELKFMVNNMVNLAEKFDKELEGLMGNADTQKDVLESKGEGSDLDTWKTIVVNNPQEALDTLGHEQFGMIELVKKFKEVSGDSKKKIFDALKSTKDKLGSGDDNKQKVDTCKQLTENFNTTFGSVPKVAQAIFKACNGYYTQYKAGGSSTTKEGNSTNTSTSSSSAENAGSKK